MTADYAGTSKAHQRRMTPLGREKSEAGNEALTDTSERSSHRQGMWEYTAAGIHRLTSLWTNHSSVRGCSGYSGVY